MEFTFPNVLKIITDDIGMTLPKLADGLNRERSLINKWMSGKHKPRPEYMPLIVETILKNSTVSQLIIVTAHLTEFIQESGLPKNLKDALLSKTGDCAAFLFEILTISINDLPISPDVPVPAYKVRVSRFITAPICAIVSAFLGGALWTLANQVLGWTFYMGSPGGEPYGFSALIWGFLTFLPHIVIYPVFLKKEIKPKLIGSLSAYIIAGSLSAVLFYTSGIRAAIEGLGFSFQISEIIIVIIYSFIISAPPYIVLRIFYRSSPGIKKTSLHLGLPIAAALLAVLLTLFIGLSKVEVAGVRGLLVGMFMRSCIFYVMSEILKQ